MENVILILQQVGTNMKLQNMILYFQIGNFCDCHVA